MKCTKVTFKNLKYLQKHWVNSTAHQWFKRKGQRDNWASWFQHQYLWFVSM